MTPGWFKVPNAIADKLLADLSHAELKTLLCIESYRHGDEVSWPSLATIGRRCGMTRRSAIRAVASLEAKGLLQTAKCHGESTRYRVEWHGGDTSVTGDTHVTTQTQNAPRIDGEAIGGDTHVTTKQRQVVTPTSPPVVTPVSPDVEAVDVEAVGHVKGHIRPSSIVADEKHSLPPSPPSRLAEKTTAEGGNAFPAVAGVSEQGTDAAGVARQQIVDAVVEVGGQHPTPRQVAAVLAQAKAAGDDWAEVVARQCEWLPFRGNGKPLAEPLMYLRKACVEDYQQPKDYHKRQQSAADREALKMFWRLRWQRTEGGEQRRILLDERGDFDRYPTEEEVNAWEAARNRELQPVRR